MIKRFASYYRPHIALFTADMICALVYATCDLFYPMITRRMLNSYIPEGNLRLLLTLAGVLVAIYILKTALTYFIDYYGHVVGVRIQADMRREVFDHLQRLPLTYFDNNKTGTIMSRIINDLMDISELAHHGPEDLFLSLIMLIGAFVIMASIYQPLALIVFAAVPLMILFSQWKRIAMSRASAEARVEIGEVNANLENSISGIRVSKAYAGAEYENEQFARGNAKFVRARGRYYRAMAEFFCGTGLIGDLLNVILYVAGGLFCFYGKITIADFTAFVLYISIFMNPIRRLIAFVEQLQNGMTGFERFCEIMDYPEESDGAGAIDIGTVDGRIEFDDVSFSYDGGRDILSGISFSVEPGRTLALVGPSGGGKSTICNLIPRFYRVTDGEVRVDGVNVNGITLTSLRRNIGVVAQDVFLFNASIYDNIAYGCPDATEEDVHRAAKSANIYDYIMSLEHGFETAVGERGVKLSGGQKQRISIARVFLKDPAILILDEATSALDNVSELMIQESLERLCAGRTTIVVAHRLTTVRGADEILVVTDDGIAERGTHDELVSAGGIYSRLWRGIRKA